MKKYCSCKWYTVQSYMKHRFWQEFLLSDRNCTTSLFTATSRILSWGTLHYGRNSKLLSENYETFFILLRLKHYSININCYCYILCSLQRTKNKRMLNSLMQLKQNHTDLEGKKRTHIFLDKIIQKWPLWEAKLSWSWCFCSLLSFF